MPNRIYDWDYWFAETEFTMLYGLHYNCCQSSIVQQIRNQAARRGLLVKVEDTGRTVRVLVTPKVEVA